MDDFGPSEDDVILLKKLILKNIMCKTDRMLYKDEYDQLTDILSTFIELGVSDSVLLIGPPGCGKTTLVKDAVEDSARKFGSESFLLVKLNGFVHTNDNFALQEIIRSLHVDDLPETCYVSGSFADNLTFVLQSFKSGNRDVSKPVVFVIDDFDRFCSHNNQTLLYNLFDVAQSAQAPVCVIGITPRIDITEMFEKRVESRFSQRQISLYPISDCKYYLKFIDNALKLNDKSKESVKIKYCVTKWNLSVNEFIKNKNVVKSIRRIIEFNPNFKLLKNILAYLTRFLNVNHVALDENDLNNTLNVFMADRMVCMIKDLSILELCLVVAMKHQNVIFDDEPMNFEMVYQRYKKFAGQTGVNTVEYSVVYKAFERLKEMEIIVPVNSSGERLKKKEFVLYSFILTNQQVEEALNSYENLPTDISQWAFSSLATA